MKQTDHFTLIKQPKELIEPEVDCGLWEKMYGRKLSHAETQEIETNLTDFFGILINEDKRIRKAK